MIRWIRNRLGTAPFDSLRPSDAFVVDVRHLVDKGGNLPAQVRSCIEAGLGAFREGTTVIVTCDLGISRSNAVAAGILSLAESRPYDDALIEVAAVTGETEIKIDIAQTVRRALGTSPHARRDTILVTGASGFLGRTLLPKLSANDRVVGPSRSELDLSKGTLNLDRYCSDYDVGQIVHLAYPRQFTNNIATSESINILISLLNVCKINKIRLVYISDAVVFGGYVSSALVSDETLPMRPSGPYGDAKFLEQTLVDLYRTRSEIEVATCRLSPVYGPGGERPRFLHNFASKILAGSIIRTHRYRNARPALDLLHVQDAASAIARVVDTTGSCTYHFGSGALHSTLEIAERIGKLAGRQVEVEELLIDDDVGNVLMDARRASAQLGWKANFDLDEGLRETLHL